MDVTAQLNEMRRRAAELRAAHEMRQPVLPTPKNPPPLDYRSFVENWWSSQPPRTREHPWQIEVIAAAAFVNAPRKPALRCVAAVLRQLQFVEKRDWTASGRNRRLWHPPSTN